MFFDENSFWYAIQNNPYYANVAEYNAATYNELYFTGWTEERTFGGSDAFYGTSTAKTNEIRLDVYAENPGAIKAYEKAGFKSFLVNMRKTCEL